MLLVAEPVREEEKKTEKAAAGADGAASLEDRRLPSLFTPCSAVGRKRGRRKREERRKKAG